MHTTLPKLGDPSQTFFDIRGFAGKGGLDRARPGGGFSTMLESMRDQQRDPSSAGLSASRANSAQNSTGEAQSLPADDGEDGDDDADAPSASRNHPTGQSPGEGGGAVETVEADRVYDAEQPDERGEAGDSADKPAGTDKPDESVQDKTRDEQSAVHARGADGMAMPADDEEGEAEEDAEQRAGRRHAVRSAPAAGGEVSANVQHKGAKSQRSEVEDSQSGIKQQREPEQRRAEPSREQRHISAAAKITDEATLPPHLEQSSKTEQDRTVEKREPIVLDPRDHREHRVMPAASRVQQVESQVRLENASGQSGATDVASRLTAAAQAGSNGSAFTGDQNGQNLPGQSLGSAERATPDDARFSGRVIRGLTAMINQRGGTMTMRLDPPELGQLRVQMTLNRGSVSASFFAQTNQARALLEKSLAALRTALENQGLTVERLNVQTSQSSNQQSHLMNDESTQRQFDQQRQDAAGGESRGKRDDRDAEHSADRRSGDFADVIERLEQTNDVRH